MVIGHQQKSVILHVMEDLEREALHNNTPASLDDTADMLNLAIHVNTARILLHQSGVSAQTCTAVQMY